MHPELEATARLIRGAVNTLDPGRADLRSPDGRWAPGDIVEHLALAFEGTVKGLSRCVASGEAHVGSVSVRQRLARLAIVELGYFPGGRKAPAHVVPKGVGLHEALARCEGALAAMDRVLVEAATTFGGERVPVLDHPIIGAFSVRDWRRFHRVHTRHHARQIAHRRTGA